ncbi:unnamed protein product [Cuscuta epithymum]|uniref:TOD1/MUCI70 glycosyltransferase-like domain-containing protein n=1 Tax=Cuscuta epithymum TaxID=186058 RepID=A0AAV0FLX7_9ASTE|nr:unnamed protein product [Cuscuta epithymum]
MPQFRQPGYGNGGGGFSRNGASSDHVPIVIRPSAHKQQQLSRHAHIRRLKGRQISIGCLVVILTVAFTVSVIAFLYITSQSKDFDQSHSQDDTNEDNMDFLTNVTRTKGHKVHFGHGSFKLGRDSQDWDKDDRRRDNDYSEEELERNRNATLDMSQSPPRGKKGDEKKSSSSESVIGLDRRREGLYNEAGRDELKVYEAEYQASLNSIDQSHEGNNSKNHPSDITDNGKKSEIAGFDRADTNTEGYDEYVHEDEDYSTAVTMNKTHSFDKHDDGINNKNAEDAGKVSSALFNDESFLKSRYFKGSTNSIHDSQSARTASEKQPVSRKRSKKRPCEMKLLNSSALLVEPLESRKFVRFSLQYTESEEKSAEDDKWEPRFAGHQTMEEREKSFVAHNQKINCGFVKAPAGATSTGFDLAEDDAKYISSCHIAVISCIFGNSDRLRMPAGKTISRTSRKNVCFVMFVDEATLKAFSSEGRMLDSMGFIGLWKIVVVKNLPYTDMRRVGKIPKLLPHRLFTSARYSIWLDSKLRLQLDPLLILEYFLWRKGHEYAISNHYDRHCVWEEVAQNKKLNKYNHSIIDQQFEVYKADGLKKFDISDPNRLLPSNVPEGSFIIRAHTPMSNLFSCLWFNEVDRFTPRDQLSFAYTYYKLRRMNPEKPFYLHMFKDCERRKIAKLFRHRSDERRKIISQHEME